MSIHIGDLIYREVFSKRLTYKQFGELIHRNEKTIPDIFERASMSTDLLITICKALNKDILGVYYTEEPMKSLRNDECIQYVKELKNVNEQLSKLSNENRLLEEKLSLTQEMVTYLKDIISFAKENIAGLKMQNDRLLNNMSDDIKSLDDSKLLLAIENKSKK